MGICRCGWLAVFLGMVLSGCSSVPMPDRSSSTMVIGMVELKGVEDHGKGDAEVLDLAGGYVRVTIENSRTRQERILKSDHNGFFFTDTLPTGRYALKSFYLKQREGYQSVTINPEAGRESQYFCVSAGKINNLGMIVWEKGAENQSDYRLNMGYAEVESQFRNLDSGGRWRDVPVTELRHTTKRCPPRRVK